jgi:hypothetical protein
VSDARGDWFAAGLRFEGAGPTAYVRSAVSDQEKLDAAIKGLLQLPALPSVKTSLEKTGIRISSGKAAAEGLTGEVWRVRFERINASTSPAGANHSPAPNADPRRSKRTASADPAAGGSSLPSSIELFYLVKNDRLFAAAGYDPKEALRRLVVAPEGENLGGVASLKAALAPLGQDTSFALVMDPLRLVASRVGKPGSGVAAPVVIAAGAAPAASGAPATLWARADIANVAIRELVRYRGAF